VDDELPALPTPPPASSPAVRASMQGNRRKDTKPEVAVRSLLHRAGLRFRKHVRPLSGLRCEADIVFPRQRVAVFVDGCFWHGCPEHGGRPARNSDYWNAKIARNVARDRRNDDALAAADWTVLRFWEHDDPQAVLAAVRATLGRQPARGEPPTAPPARR
jgi:DNA mismatch endonuclease (patch repair protein)